ncbi:MAG: hypothetical protein IJ773_09130 [Lachnospiraceae bacterium]|nr:hypothetical protein [Lachnospiraceae bacterium]
MKMNKSLLKCTILLVLVIAIIFVIRSRDITNKNQQTDIITKLGSSQVENIIAIGKHPIRELELTPEDQTKIANCLTQIRLYDTADPNYNVTVGETQTYYPFRIEFNDGQEFIVEIGYKYYIIWSETDAFYYETLPKDSEKPGALPVLRDDLQKNEEFMDLVKEIYTSYVAS